VRLLVTARLPGSPTPPERNPSPLPGSTCLSRPRPATTLARRCSSSSTTRSVVLDDPERFATDAARFLAIERLSATVAGWLAGSVLGLRRERGRLAARH